jgi:hypothetical protein
MRKKKNSQIEQVHCWWLDKSEKYSWPFLVGDAASPRFAGPPLVIDLDRDGRAEVCEPCVLTCLLNRK